MTNEKQVKEEVRTFTYVGAGEQSPHVIKFMGKIDMVRGEPVEIPVAGNEALLKKIEGVHTIVEGKADRKSLQDMDVQAKEKADVRRKEDDKINLRAQKALGRAK